MSKKQCCIIFITAILFSIFTNELNKYYVKQNNPENNISNTKSLVEDATIWSIDNEWYLPHIKYIFSGEGYTLDPNNPEMKVRRTPGYPLFYGLHYIIFKEKLSFFYIRYTQVLIFALAALLLALSVYNFSKNSQWAFITGLLYGLSPFIAIYNYFTITEAIFPSLVVFSIYFFSRFFANNKLKHLFFCGIFLGITFLTRPLTGIVLIGFGFALLVYVKNLKKTFIYVSVLVGGFCTLISPWVVRNYYVTNGEIIIAEKIYYGAPMSAGRSHISHFSLVSTWLNPQNNYSSIINIEKEVLLNHSPYKLDSIIDNYIDTWPKSAFKGYTKADLKEAIISCHQCWINKDAYLKENPNAKIKDRLNLPCEDEVAKNFKMLKEKYVRSAPFAYYIIQPLILTKEAIFHSHSTAFASLNPKSKDFNFVQIFIKSIMYLMNVFLFISVLIIFLFSKNKPSNFLVLTSVISLIIIFVFIMRSFEVRYFLGVYPLMYISLGYLIYRFKYYFYKMFKNNIDY